MSESVDPREWSQDQVEEFSRSATEDQLITLYVPLLEAGDPEALDVLVRFLAARHEETFLKSGPSQLAARALIASGPRGVEALFEALLDGETRVRYAPAVLALLWEVGRSGTLTKSTALGPSGLLDLEVSDPVREAANGAVRDIFAQALTDLDAFFLVVQFTQQAGLSTVLAGDGSEGEMERAVDMMSLFAEASIKLSRSVLDEFRQLISEERLEEDYQRFLAANPVLLDPLAAEVVPKQKLGTEFATDYAIRSHDDRWMLVEIERPHDHPFTQANDFNSRFGHAVGQVLDFVSWVDDNVAYAQTQMQSIVAPRGTVVIGLRDRLDEAQKRKLRQFNSNSQRIEVLTFDDLLSRGETLYKSLRHR